MPAQWRLFYLTTNIRGGPLPPRTKEGAGGEGGGINHIHKPGYMTIVDDISDHFMNFFNPTTVGGMGPPHYYLIRGTPNNLLLS